MSLYPFISLVAFCIILFVGVYVFSREKRKSTRTVFLAYSFISAFLTLSEYLYSTAKSHDEAIFFLKPYLLAWLIFLTVQIHFFLEYSGSKSITKKGFLFLLYAIAGSVFLFLSFSEFYLDIQYFHGNWIRAPLIANTIHEFIFGIMLTSLTIYTTYLAIRYLLASKRKTDRVRAILVMIGLMVPTWAPFFKNGMLPTLNVTILFPDSPFILFGWIFIVVAIVFFRMFDIDPKSAADQIIGVIKEALLLLDKEGRIKFANKAFLKLFGLEPKAVLEVPISELFVYSDCATNEIGERYKTEDIKNKTCTFNHPGGEKYYLNFSSSFLIDDYKEHVGFVCVLSDVTDLVHSFM